jgi:hypothetical protein
VAPPSLPYADGESCRCNPPPPLYHLPPRSVSRSASTSRSPSRPPSPSRTTSPSKAPLPPLPSPPASRSGSRSRSESRSSSGSRSASRSGACHVRAQAVFACVTMTMRSVGDWRCVTACDWPCVSLRRPFHCARVLPPFLACRAACAVLPRVACCPHAASIVVLPLTGSVSASASVSRTGSRSQSASATSSPREEETLPPI